MSPLVLLWRGLQHYSREHALVVAGVALAVAVMAGALVVGDSVRDTLMRRALDRVGKVSEAMVSDERPVGEALADRLAARTGRECVPCLVFPGIALSHEGRESAPVQVNHIRIIGREQRFNRLAAVAPEAIPPHGVALNDTLARRLGVSVGDTVALRFARPTGLPREAPLSRQGGDGTIRATFTVTSVVPPDALGNLDLRATQVIPDNAFVNLGELQALAGLPGRVNVLLAGEGKAAPQDRDTWEEALCAEWRLDDVGLEWRADAPVPLQQLESRNVMMNAAVWEAASAIGQATGALTYLVNAIGCGAGPAARSTPYSFILAGGLASDRGLPDHGILLNQWAAEQLGARVGDPVVVSYSRIRPGGGFEPTQRVFAVQGIVPMDVARAERDLAPHFPGLSDVGRCADWDIGLPMEAERLVDPANEAYWDLYHDTPKAFVSLAAGQAMWGSRFGNLTALRVPISREDRTAWERRLLARLTPGQFGLRFMPVREPAVRSVEAANDFGMLFSGLSLFLVLAALLLAGLLFHLGTLRRQGEMGLLLALGIPARTMGRLFLAESALLALVGSLLGGAGAVLYGWLMLALLSSLWSSSLPGMVLHFAVRPMSLLLGIAGGVMVALVSLWVSVRGVIRRIPRDLLAGVSAAEPSAGKRGRRGRGVIPWAGLVAATLLSTWGWGLPTGERAGLFLLAGALLLLSLLGLLRRALDPLASWPGRFSLVTMGLGNATRHPGRSMAVVTMLASGSFIVMAVAALRDSDEGTLTTRDSGTGGFALMGETAVALPFDPATRKGWQRLHLDSQEALHGVELVSIIVKEGDDASCLNLDRAQNPRLLGLDPEAMQSRGAFGREVWSLLSEPLRDGEIPVLAGDGTTAEWGLQARIGLENGTLFRVSDERGQEMRLRLVGALPPRVSLFQGSLILARRTLEEHFPSLGGTRQFLVEAPQRGVESVQVSLRRALAQWGGEITATPARLRAFLGVESTYMAMFAALGGLGLLLGCAGVAIVVLRASYERQGEYAVLRAMGYPRGAIAGLILVEHSVLAVAGIAIGVVSALLALVPLIVGGQPVRWLGVLGWPAALIAALMLWIVLATQRALRAGALPGRDDPV